ncbi:DUF4880 domain-containing protein [Comamonas sp. Tr-654]|uniref:FecR family protein n=1 Tax=Comamonas sp. Tr-654 TaxID=2608341 RepID=UPI0014224E67|nr:FecR domain-containing protein [Comamonas sp. Tr-654]NIF86071.1 DUF4880 domain-containing protein [Comamonas sp. Tr-654]
MTKTPDNDAHHTSDMLQQQAWQWLRLLHSGVASHEDAESFRQWVRSSPVHQRAYEEARDRWNALKQPVSQLLQSQPTLVSDHQRAVRQRAHGRRVFLGAGVASMAVAVVGVNYSPLGLWPTASDLSADYRTTAGEQRTVAVNERVQLTLNTRTTISQQTDGDETIGLHLLHGELALEVQPGVRPFAVKAGVGRALTESGQLEVSLWGKKVCVTCLAGQVQLSHPAGSRVLKAHQQAVYDSAAVSGILGVDAAAVSSWRRGMLVFKHIRLAEVLEEINRYRPGRVVLINAAVREKYVTGNFAVASLDLALIQLQHTFSLHARSLPGGLVLLS